MSLPLAEFRANGGLLLTEGCGYTAGHGNLLDPFASLSKESCHIHHTKQLPLQEMYYSSQKKTQKNAEKAVEVLVQVFSWERPLPTLPLSGMCFFLRKFCTTALPMSRRLGIEESKNLIICTNP